MKAVGCMLSGGREAKWEARMTGFRELVSIVMVGCLMPVGFPQQAQAVAVEQSSETAAGLQRQLRAIPAGAVVEVKLQQKGSDRVTGNLGPVTDHNFEVQTVKSGKVFSKNVAFADVESVKEKKGMSRGTRWAVKGAIVGVLSVVAYVVIRALVVRSMD